MPQRRISPDRQAKQRELLNTLAEANEELKIANTKVKAFEEATLQPANAKWRKAYDDLYLFMGWDR